MLAQQRPNYGRQPSFTDHDLTELSWLTRSDIFDRTSAAAVARPTPILTRSLPVYGTNSKSEQPRHHHHSSITSLLDSSDSEHDNDSSSLNSSSERVVSMPTDIISPPHSALCFWILFAIEQSKTQSLTLNEICDWVEQHIERPRQHLPIASSDEQLIHSARLKSKIRYHMTKQISFFVKIVKDPVNGIKLRYPLWATDRSKRSLLLDTLLTMNARQLSLSTQHTIDIYERLCRERRQSVLGTANDENSCPMLLFSETKRDKIVHRLASTEEPNVNSKRKKQRSKRESTSTSAAPSVEVVDAAMTLLLLRQTK